MVPHGQDWAALCRDYRLRHGLKQEAMAQDFNVDQSTVSRWERGLREPAMHVKQAILNDRMDRGEADPDQPLQLLLGMSGSAVAVWDRGGTLRGCTPRFERELAETVVREDYRDAPGTEILGQHGNALLDRCLALLDARGFFAGALTLAVLTFAPVMQERRKLAGGTVTVSMFPVRLGPVSDPLSGLFAVRLDAVDLTDLAPDGFKILMELLLANPTLRIAEVGYGFQQRHAGESKASTGEMVRYLGLLARRRMQPSPPRVVRLPSTGLRAPETIVLS